MNKYWYFRFTMASIADDDDVSSDSIVIPIKNITGLHFDVVSGIKTTCKIFFKNNSSRSATMPAISNSSLAIIIEGRDGIANFKAFAKVLAETSNINKDLCVIVDNAVPSNIELGLKDFIDPTITTGNFAGSKIQIT